MESTYYNTKNALALNVSTLNTDTTTNGNIVDMANFKDGKVVLATGTVTAGTVVVSKIQESPNSDMSSAVDIPANRLYGSFGVASTANTLKEVGFTNVERYVRVSFLTAGTANLQAMASIVKGRPLVAPVQ